VDFVPLFDEAGADAHRRRIEDQGQFHRLRFRFAALYTKMP
jgi:hypothetical protein